MQRKAILVLGMHRSGTSAFARVLSLLGCDLPHTLMPGWEGNPKGHWESNAIREFNDELLASAGSDWIDWLEFNPGWYESPLCESFSERALQVLNVEYGSSALFVLKDPRNCRLTRFWFDVLDKANVEPLIAIPLRNPLEVTDSLEARNGMNRELAMLAWLRHVLDAEHGSRGHRRIFSHYDELLENWAGLAQRMQDILGVTWPCFSARVAMDIDAFLDRDSRHHAHSAKTVLSNPVISTWVRDAYAILLKWVTAGEDRNEYPALDNIRQQLNASGPAFAKLAYAVSDGQDQQRELHALVQAKEAALVQLNGEILALRDTENQQADHRKTMVAAYEAQVRQLQEDHHKLEAESSDARARAQELETALSTASRKEAAEAQAFAAERDRLSRQLAEREALLAELGSARDILVDNLHAAQENLEQLGREVVDRGQALDQIHGTLRQREEEMSAIAARAQALETALSAASGKEDAEAKAFAAERDRLNRQLAEHQASLTELGSAKAALARSLHAAQASLEDMKKKSADHQHEIADVRSTLRQREEEMSAIAARAQALETALSAASGKEDAEAKAFAAERDRLNRQLAEHQASLTELGSAKAALARSLHAAQASLEDMKKKSADHQHEIADVRSTLRQREEEISQTLANLDKERQNAVQAEADRRAMAEKLARVQDKLKAADEWVFRLAGDRKIAEGQIASAESRFTMVESENVLAAVRLTNMERRFNIQSLENADLAQQKEDMIRNNEDILHKFEEQMIINKEQAKIIKNLRQEKDSAEQRWAAAQSEIATLGTFLRQKEAELGDVQSALAQARMEQHEVAGRLQAKGADMDRQARRVEWLQEVNDVVTGYPHWWAFVPKRWREKWQQGRLLRKGLFDAEAYLARYPDVLSSEMDPLRHYIIHGIREQRTFQ